MTEKALKKASPLVANEINSHDLALNLVDLYWFIHIIDAGSFSTAANNHGISKSSLSRRISQLETRLGVQLLHRNPRFLSLTSIGAQVYRHSLDMLTAAQLVSDSVQQALETPTGQVNIVLPSILNSWLLPVLQQFKKTYPHINLTLYSDDRTQELNSQSIDLALSLSAAPFDSSQIVTRPLASLTFVNIVSTRCCSAEKNAPILLSYLNSNDNNHLQVNNYRSALDAVQAGFGYTNLPLCACRTGLSTGDLKYYDQQEEQHTLFAFTQHHRGITLATRVLLDYLTHHITHVKTLGILPLESPQGNILN